MSTPDLISPETIAQMLRRSLSVQSYALATVTSGSMRPLLDIGDQIGLTAVLYEELKEGDLITYETANELMTHRVARLMPPHYFVTRGDRNVEFDMPCAREQIVGRVVMRRRGDDILDLRQGEGRVINKQLHALSLQEANHFTRPYWRYRIARTVIRRSYLLMAQSIVAKA